MGGFNGGTAKAFKQLIDTISQNTDIDEKNSVVARWHDESHLNRYLYDKNPLILSPAYGYPENRVGSSATHKEFHKTHKLLIMDKSNPKWGGHQYLRGQTNNRIGGKKETKVKQTSQIKNTLVPTKKINKKMALPPKPKPLKKRANKIQKKRD